MTQLAYLRPHNRHARYRNVYFAGASTHPGTGVPTALVSGRLAAERITDEQPASSSAAERARLLPPAREGPPGGSATGHGMGEIRQPCTPQ